MTDKKGHSSRGTDGIRTFPGGPSIKKNEKTEKTKQNEEETIMAEFTVTAAEVRNKSTELKELNAKYKAVIGELEAEIGKLQAMWEGEAHDTFKREFTKDVTRMDEFCAAIDAYANALEKIKKTRS